MQRINTGFSRTGWATAGVGAATIATLALTTAPAGAHHDPGELARTEIIAESIAAPPATQGGLPVGLIIAATLALAALVLITRGVRPSRRSIAIVATGALCALPLAAMPANAATMLLPDLISDQPDPVGGVEINTYTGEPRLILRFDGYVTNIGDGPLEVSGNPQLVNSANSGAVHQRALDSDGNWNVVGTPIVQYETADGHNHFHLMQVGRYSLWNEAQTAEAAPGQKVGFCLYDIERAEAEDYNGPRYSRVYSGSVTQFCDSNNPNTTDLVMGTSAGWRDVYGAYLTYQWVDVSDTAPGTYYLANEADPFDRIVESNESNNQVGFSEQTSTIPGYNALAVGPVVTTEDTSVAVTLASESFGSPGSRRFEIVTPPAHGSLNVATGASFSSPNLTYTPDPGYDGADSFDYVARDNSSDYPFNPTRAAVSIDVGAALDPAVQISGAPASLIAGTSADLDAAVIDAPGGVSWSVDGVSGGNGTVGTVDSSGLYIAPGAVPAGGSVTVRAALDDDPSVFDEVTIVIDPIPNQAPNLADPGSQASTIGDTVSLPLEANDPNGDPFTFAASGLPTGLGVHPATGVISGTATETGTFSVSVTADDGTDATVIDFDWTVDPRAEVAPGIAVILEGDSGSQVISVPLTLSEAVSQPVTVDWTTADTGNPGIAQSGSDYEAASGQVTFAPGATSATVDITVYGDTDDEPPAWLGEWGVVAFSSPSPNADLSAVFYGLGIFVIIDDD